MEDMDVSNPWGYPKSSILNHVNRLFQYKPSISNFPYLCKSHEIPYLTRIFQGELVPDLAPLATTPSPLSWSLQSLQNSSSNWFLLSHVSHVLQNTHQIMVLSSPVLEFTLW